MVLIKFQNSVRILIDTIRNETTKFRILYSKSHCFDKYRGLCSINEASVCDQIDLTNIRIALDKTITVLSVQAAGPSWKALRYQDTHTRLVVVVNRERMDGRKDRGG